MENQTLIFLRKLLILRSVALSAGWNAFGHSIPGLTPRALCFRALHALFLLPNVGVNYMLGVLTVSHFLTLRITRLKPV
jgi:hypothetical protein